MTNQHKLSFLLPKSKIILVFIFLITIFLTLQTPTIAQRITPTNVWQQVYKQLPHLAKENQYISKDTGKPAINNTLVGRLVLYHIYQKGRSPNHRLDWKLTLADYLDANETMYDSVYPGADSLRNNPLVGDRLAISKLNHKQRNQLIDVLVNIFTPQQNQ